MAGSRNEKTYHEKVKTGDNCRAAATPDSPRNRPARKGNMKRLITVTLAGILLATTGQVPGEVSRPEGPDARKIRSAMSAAPTSVSREAAIMDWPSKAGAQPAVIRAGKNGWTCLPDNPGTPGNDPMCLDRQWMKWLDAYLNKTSPAIDAVGIAYMLQGGADASNSDPFASKPAHGEHWIMAPPHIMVIAPGKLDPQMFSSDPHSGEHWIMFGGTPYEHLMIPVK